MLVYVRLGGKGRTWLQEIGIQDAVRGYNKDVPFIFPTSPSLVRARPSSTDHGAMKPSTAAGAKPRLLETAVVPQPLMPSEFACWHRERTPMRLAEMSASRPPAGFSLLAPVAPGAGYNPIHSAHFRAPNDIYSDAHVRTHLRAPPLFADKFVRAAGKSRPDFLKEPPF